MKEDLQKFAHAAAHDLRSPLNSGLGLLQLLKRRAKDTLSAEDLNVLDRAMDNFQRLSMLMQDVLAFSLVISTPPKLEAMSLQDPLDAARARLKDEIDAVQATVEAGPLPVLDVDKSQMTAVFQHLLGNAIKYRREVAPRIFVAAFQEGAMWHFSIRDNGQGFEAKHAQQIFEPFKRLHGPDVPGSGIGLATCKFVIENAGGMIWNESTPGQGSTFHFTLPSASV